MFTSPIKGNAMKLLAMALTTSLSLSGCTSAVGDGIEPIPGSITYRGQPHTKLTKSPIGSSFPHDFYDQYGRHVEETYVIQPDRTLRLVNRVYIDVDRFGRP
jgi:hypothetical protein